MKLNYIKTAVALAVMLLIIGFVIYDLYEAVFEGLVYVKRRGWQTFQQSPVRYIFTVASGMIFLIFLAFLVYIAIMAKRADVRSPPPRLRDLTLYDDSIVRLTSQNPEKINEWLRLNRRVSIRMCKRRRSTAAAPDAASIPPPA